MTLLSIVINLTTVAIIIELSIIEAPCHHRYLIIIMVVLLTMLKEAAAAAMVVLLNDEMIVWLVDPIIIIIPPRQPIIEQATRLPLLHPQTTKVDQ
jgi:hypothetical protein